MADGLAITGSRTERMRDMMLDGKEFNANEAAKEFDLSIASVSLCIRHLKMLGYKFDKPDIGYFRLTNPNHKPSTAQWEHLRTYRNKPARDTPPPPHERPESAKLPQTVPLPTEERRSPNFGLMDGAAGILGMPGFERAEPVNFRGVQPPNLGGMVSVFAQMIQDDGTLRLGLQTGERRWVVDVIGEIAR